MAPTSISSPARWRRLKATLAVMRSRVSSQKPASRMMRRASSQLTQSSTAAISPLPMPAAPAWAASSSTRQSPHLEWVLSILPEIFTSLPTWPTSSAPRKPSSRQASRESPMKLLVRTAFFQSACRLSFRKSAP